MSKDHLIISGAELFTFLTNDERCTREQREEVLKTINSIDCIDGRKWVFYHDWKEYIIDEYNEHNDFIKTYTFKV